MGNATLLTLLEGISSRTVRARVWRGLLDDNAGDRAVAEHQAIYGALATRDAPLAHAAALTHVSATERWFREHLEGGEAVTRTAVGRECPPSRPRTIAREAPGGER